MRLKRSPPLTDRARGLRRAATEAEDHLWQHLRARGLAGLRFARQRPIGSYVADFYCPERGLVIEIDGGSHASPAQRAYDEERNAYLVGCGLTVVRFTNAQVLSDIAPALEAIRRALDPHP